jgi:class 3 adenylate cyclase
MAEERVQRRLAAILAADMVGYSRLMGVDEEGTISRQKTHRAELIDPEIAAHGGRIVKTTGDGLLVEFASVVDAVKCAVAIQKGMAGREGLSSTATTFSATASTSPRAWKAWPSRGVSACRQKYSRRSAISSI